MVKNKLDTIKKLINTINLNNLNLNLINKNSVFLYDLHKQIKQYWENINHRHEILSSDNKHFKNILKITKNSLVGEYDYIDNELKKVNNIVKLNNSTIEFYYIDLGNYKNDILLINELFNQSICLAKYQDLYDKQNILIIWIPVERKRDFNFEIINEENIKKSIDKFNAFTASGVTYGRTPKITVITRYEEISKLLLHELIHNYNIDGSSFHEHNHDIIKDYVKIKNPKTPSGINNYDYSYSIYESYTELLSSYFSMIFRNINLEIKEELIERFKIEIIIEIIYSYNTISNLIKLNNYEILEDFKKEKKFRGDICVYEYYYLKGLLYNNYELCLCNSSLEFKNNYEKIINIDKDDLLLEDIFRNYVKQTNFSYIFYDFR